MAERSGKAGQFRGKRSGTASTATLQGDVIAAHGRHYLVELQAELPLPESTPAPASPAALAAQPERLLCVTRGKKNDVATGDQVRLTRTSGDQGVIEEIIPRQTFLYRSDQYRSKLLAANLTQILIVIATEPSFSDDLVSRSLVAAEAADISARLILNKVDLTPNLTHARKRAERYSRIGYPITEVSAKTNPEATRALLAPLLSGQSTILIGQSGMGKSSLINLMIPGLDLAVREISAALDTGKHTTTYTKRYALDIAGGGNVVDSPGFQEFGLYHLSEGMLERAFPEFLPHLGNCRFTNCHHAQEPGCAIVDAVEKGEIHPERRTLFLQLCHESSQTLY